MTQIFGRTALLLAGSIFFPGLVHSLQAQETATIVKFMLVNRVTVGYDLWEDDYTSDFTYKNSKGRMVTIRTVDTLFSYAKAALSQKLGVRIDKRETVGDAKQNMLGKITGFPNDKIKDVAGLAKQDKLIEVNVTVYPEPVSTKEEKKVIRRTYYTDMLAEVKVYDKQGNEIERYKQSARTDDTKWTEEVRNSRNIINLTGIEYVSLFAKAFDAALANKKQ